MKLHNLLFILFAVAIVSPFAGCGKKEEKSHEHKHGHNHEHKHGHKHDRSSKKEKICPVCGLPMSQCTCPK